MTPVTCDHWFGGVDPPSLSQSAVLPNVNKSVVFPNHSNPYESLVASLPFIIITVPAFGNTQALMVNCWFATGFAEVPKSR